MRLEKDIHRSGMSLGMSEKVVPKNQGKEKKEGKVGWVGMSVFAPMSASGGT